MTKFYGEVGYVITVETQPGIWEEQKVQRNYYGDIIRNTRKLKYSDEINDSVSVSNEISIIADPFANQNFHSMRYAKYMGAKWKISNVEVSYPRLILTLGDVYNGD